MSCNESSGGFSCFRLLIAFPVTCVLFLLLSFPHLPGVEFKLNAAEQLEQERRQQRQHQQMHLQSMMKRDAHTHKREGVTGVGEEQHHSDSSSDQVTVIESRDQQYRPKQQYEGRGMDPGIMMHRSRSFYQDAPPPPAPSIMDMEIDRRSGRIPVREKPRHISKSKSPIRERRMSRNPYQTRVQPAIPPNIDVYGILENVAKTEGSFAAPEEALRAVIAAFTQDTW